MHSSRPIARKTATIKEAMQIASVGRRTLFGWLKDGKVESVRTAGGRRLIYVDTLFQAKNTNARKISEERLMQIAAQASHESFVEHQVERGARREDLPAELHRHDIERAEHLVKKLKKLGYCFPLRSYRPR